jgi:hypothetical protein
MTKQELAAFVAQATTEFEGKVKRIAAGDRSLTERQVYTQAHASDAFKAREAKREARRQEREDDRITVVTDHCGREFLKNSAGEWL